jgi:hypothetical protein
VSGISDGVSKVWIQRFENRSMHMDGFANDYDAIMSLVQRCVSRDDSTALNKIQSLIEEFREHLRVEDEREKQNDLDECDDDGDAS